MSSDHSGINNLAKTWGIYENSSDIWGENALHLPELNINKLYTPLRDTESTIITYEYNRDKINERGLNNYQGYHNYLKIIDLNPEYGKWWK